MRKIFLALTASAALSACAPPPPANPMERHARMAAAAELAARQCAGYAGGYSGAREMRADAGRHIATARQMGATDQDIANARQAAQTAFDTGVVWIGRHETCAQMVSQLAWQA